MNLERLLRPRSIAVIGGGAWCEAVIRRLQDWAFPGAVWPVHPSRGSVADLPAFASVADLPDAPDAAFVGVNRQATIEVVQALSARGAGGAVCFASGFKESEDGEPLQQSLASAAGAMPLFGPNCYGFINALDRAALWPDVHGLTPVEQGVAIIGQSSNILLNLTMQRRALPVAYLVAAGNQAVVGMADIGRALLHDERVTALGLHVEGFGDIRCYEVLAALARQKGKAIVVLKSGRSTAAQQATLTHTASLAGSEAGARALMARLGMMRAASLTQFLSILTLAHLHGRRRFERIASLSCSGGEASLMADTAEDLPLTYPLLTDEQKTTFRKHLRPPVRLVNPLDYHTAIWRDREAMQAVFAAMAADHIDMTCLVLDYPHPERCARTDWDICLEALIAAKEQSGGRFALVASLPENMPEDIAARALDAGIAPLLGLDDALASLAATLQPPASSASEALGPVLFGAGGGERVTLSEAEAKAELADFGLRVPPSETADTADEAAARARAIGFPVVLKGEGAAHKSEAGLVRLGLMSEQAVYEATRAMPAKRFLVEAMVPDGVAELLVGVVLDPAHGFVLTIGAGGTLTELLDDATSLLIPSSRATIETALSGLKIARLLQGYRGKPPADPRRVLEAIEAVQAYIVANADRVVEVEINPLIVTPEQAIAVDALIVRKA
ncbi:MAG: acetate--CoA ligase family protein [Alphaproteobacteria bacterium]